MIRTFWLSFCDNHRPPGQRFLGVCVVDVTDEMAAEALEKIRREFPRAQAGAEWIAAATAQAWFMCCNPGGEVASLDITGAPQADAYPRDRLLTQRILDSIQVPMEGQAVV